MNKFFSRLLCVFATASVMMGSSYAQTQLGSTLDKRTIEKGQSIVLSKMKPVDVANQELAPNASVNATHKQAPGFTGGSGSFNPNAMWDIQFDFDPLPNTVGIVWTGTEFWCTKWQLAVDSVFTFDINGVQTGAFTITGIGSVRGMTSDGTSVYMANGTNTIRKVSIATQAVTGTFTVPALAGAQTTVRWITYDPSGTGGFWVGNFGTALTKINNPASGTATVNAAATIAAATHGLTGMYGAAYDGTSPGGPYLWVHNQSDPQGGASTDVIVQVQLPSGAVNPVQHDVDADYGSTGGSAGGLTIAQLPGYTQRSMVAVNQGVKIVSYELNFVNTSVSDVRADSLDPSNGLTLWPLNQNGPISFALKTKNVGNTAVTNITRSVVVEDAISATTINTFTIPSLATLAAGASQVVSTSTYNYGPNGISIYIATGTVDAAADANASNDTTFAIFEISDSTFARDYAGFGSQVGSVGIGAGSATSPKLAQSYTLAVADQLTSITGFFAAPSAGDFTSMSIYSNNAGSPGTLLGSTAQYTFTQVDQDSGVVLTQPLTSGPLSLPAGDFWVVVNEGDSTAGIATTTDIYTPGKHKVSWSTNNGGAWTNIGDFGANFKRAFVLRPNFGSTCTAPLTVTTQATNAGCGQSNGTATASVAGGTGLTYSWSNGQTTATATGLGAGSYTVTVTDANGCSGTATVGVSNTNAPTAATLTTNPTCAGLTNGTATVTAAGGSTPYTYTWNTVPAQYTATATGLAAGTYAVSVKDAAGCISSTTVTLTAPAAITASATTVNPTCAGLSNGTATVTATGGTGALSYTWSTIPPQFTATATGLAGGSFNCTVKDANGCITSASATLTAPAALTASVSTTNATGGLNNGTATASVSGGTPGYTYTWSSVPPQFTQTATNLAPGSYTVVVIDSKGCTVTSQTGTVSGLDGWNDADKLSVYPNPNTGVFTVDMMLQNAADVSISIMDVSGRVVYATQKAGVISMNESIDLGDFAKGIYMMNVVTSNGRATVKLVIE